MAINGGTDEQPDEEVTRTATTSYGLQPPAEPVPAQAAGVEPAPGAEGPAGPTPAGAAGGGGGRLLGGRYRLLDRLGFGGMGTVWRAHDEVVDRDVAVKEPRVAEHVTGAQRRTAHLRMQREARAAARIDHPCVVTVHDVVVEDDRPWIVMELVRGRSLAEVLAEGTLPPREAARVGLAVLGALTAAHEAGVLHRDVKPANILLGRHDRVVLTDFGIAQVEGEEALTETGAFIGSPEYISPERVLGHRPGPESDLWSLGVVLYQAVEGLSPFRRQATPSTFQAVLLAELPPPRKAGPLGPAILGVLRKEPEARASAARFADELRAVLDPPRAPAPTPVPPDAAGARPSPPSGVGRALRGLRRSRRAQAGTAVVAAAAAAAVVFAVLPSGGSGVPEGWRTYTEKGVDATVSVPGDYVRSIDDDEVTYTEKHDVFTVTLSRSQGEKDSAAGVANGRLAYYKDGASDGCCSDTVADAAGTVTEAEQQGQAAAKLDMHYTDLSDDAHPKVRVLEMDVVSGKGVLYSLEVEMPAAPSQAARGKELFDDIKAHLTLNGL
jgi:hypothetical protein